MARPVILRVMGSWVLMVACVLAQSAGKKTNPPADVPAPDSSAAAPDTNSTMSRQTRLELIHVFATQVVYAHVPFPMGVTGLKIKDGQLTPGEEELQQEMAIYGPSVKKGDPAQITELKFKSDRIVVELNGGPVRKKKWYEHIEVDGGGGTVTPSSPNANAHGSLVELDFDRHVPEMNAAQFRALLAPALDFNAKSKEQAYEDAMPPKVKEAIEQHRVLVGMDTDMVLHAKGKPPKKVREHDGDTTYEEWIYGEPPDDVDFVRIVGDEVVRVETMRVGGEKIVRTDKEVELAAKPKVTEEPEEKPASSPSLMRPGEQAPDSQPTSDTQTKRPMPTGPPPNQPPGNDPPNILARVYWN